MTSINAQNDHISLIQFYFSSRFRLMDVFFIQKKPTHRIKKQIENEKRVSNFKNKTLQQR